MRASSRSPPIIALLCDIDTNGFPADYLIARVRGRRARLVAAWGDVRAHGLPPGTSDESIWQSLLEEFDWLYRQMNRSLRQCFAPLLALFELKTIVLCLRNKAAQRTTAIERLLDRSLLADGLQQALRQAPDVSSTIAAVTVVLAAITDDLGELGSTYADAGLRGFEDRLMHGYLAYVAQTRPHAVVRRFFVSFTDLRNVVILYKHLRWEIDEPAAFIPGGSIEPSRFIEIASRREPAGLDALVREVTGLESSPAAVTEGALETVLLRSLTQKLEVRGRSRGPVEVILDYVWRLYVHARNRALLFHGGELDAGTLERELIA